MSSLFSPLSDALRQQLQTSLGTVYTLERELGGGGMSRVFVARDTALGRAVVIKVLAPELAQGLSAERFAREIRLAARLQHPHLVPVHAAGDINGLPYYTMPFVEGESLRQRLTREGALPVADAVRLVRELADGLAYAHDQGVVHRDLKPENVLLSGGHPVITDFGIAKALSSATRDGASADGATGIGMAVGTPAYMAPEQAAADPATDHRADLYALGVIAFEVLAGRHPFAGQSPQGLLSAHLTQVPPHLASLRPDVPVALASLVARLLAKHPADRPQSGYEVLQALDGGSALPRPTRHFGRRHAIWFGALALTATLAAVWWARRATAAGLDDGLVLVAPFRVAGAEPSLGYLREGMLDMLAAKLTGEGGLRAIDARTGLSAWRRRAAEGDLAQEPALDVARALGAGRLVLGEVVGTPGQFVLSASLLAVPSGRVLARGSVTGPADSLPHKVDELTARLLAQQAGEGERLTALTSTSLPALRAYLDGQAVFRRGNYGVAVQHYERALEADSTFALAAMGLAEAAAWGTFDARERSTRLAWAARDRLSTRDRAYLDLIAGPRYPDLTPASEMIATAERYVQAVPDRPGAWSYLGDGLMHTGTVAGIEDAEPRAAAAFARALALDSAYVPALGHLVLLAAHRGDTAAVRRLGALFIATDSTGETADVVRWRRALMLGDTAALAEVRRRLAGAGRPIPLFGLAFISDVAQHDGVGLEDAARATAAARRQAVGPFDQFVAGYLAYDLALERGRPAEALQALESVRGLGPDPHFALRWLVTGALFGGGESPAAQAAVAELAGSARDRLAADPARRGVQYSDRCIVELWRLAQGDTRTASATASVLRAATGRDERPEIRAQNAQCAAMVDALEAVAAHRADAASRIDRLDSTLRQSPIGFPYGVHEWGALVAARLREATGDLRGALRSIRRRPSVFVPMLTLADHLREEARLAALTGDREGAIRAYRHYLALRADPEPALRAEVAQVREALAQLERASAGR